MSKTIISSVEEMVRPMLDENGFELVDIEFVKEGNNRFLRVIVDKPGGIDIDDCGRISEYVSQKLDEHDPIPDAYFLEVTSPGAERPLKKKDDYYKAVNSPIYVTTFEPVDGHIEFEGVLKSYNEVQLVIEAGKKDVRIPCDNVASARLAVVF